MDSLSGLLDYTIIVKTSGTLRSFLSSLEAVKVLEWECRVGPPKVKVKNFFILGVNRFLKPGKEESQSRALFLLTLQRLL